MVFVGGRKRQAAPSVGASRRTVQDYLYLETLVAQDFLPQDYESVSCSTASELRLVGTRQGDSTLILGWNLYTCLNKGVPGPSSW